MFAYIYELKKNTFPKNSKHLNAINGCVCCRENFFIGQRKRIIRLRICRHCGKDRIRTVEEMSKPKKLTGQCLISHEIM